MPEITTLLSQRESEAITRFAELEGITEEEAIGRLAMENLAKRLKTRFKRGEVKTFKSPKSN